MFEVFLLDSFGRPRCKVGYAKTLADQAHTIGNRVGVVSQLLRRATDKEKDNYIVVIDEWKKRDVKLPFRPGRSTHASSTATTIEMVKDMKGMAVVTFVDGVGSPLPVLDKNLGYLMPNPSTEISSRRSDSPSDVIEVDADGSVDLEECENDDD